jgi:hypothetical protein
MARQTWPSVMQETEGSAHGIALVLDPENEARPRFELVARGIRWSRPKGNYALRITREAGMTKILAAFVERADAEAFAAAVGGGSPTREGWASWWRMDFDEGRQSALEALAPKPGRAPSRRR